MAIFHLQSISPDITRDRAARPPAATLGENGQRQRYRGADIEGADGEGVAAETRGTGNR